jgi:hypothetical protein
MTTSDVDFRNGDLIFEKIKVFVQTLQTDNGVLSVCVCGGGMYVCINIYVMYITVLHTYMHTYKHKMVI